MARFDIFRGKLSKAMEKLSAPENMKRYGEAAAKMIQTRTRLGYGVPANREPRKKLLPLKPTTRDQRKDMAEDGSLSSLTSPGRSNLTRSGQLLESFAVSARKGEAEIAPRGDRSDGKTNEDIARYQAEKGRVFNNLSNVEAKRLDEMFEEDLEKFLKQTR